MTEAGAGRVFLHKLAGRKKAHVACGLVAKLYEAGRSVVVFVSDPARAAVLDEYLWTFAQSAFVPHTRWNGLDAPEDPVLIVTESVRAPGNADALVIVGRLDDPAAARAFVEIHDLDADTEEDAGKRGAWEAAGFSVVEAGGGKGPR
jgi:DNA polymerase IIIc chi subunit